MMRANTPSSICCTRTFFRNQSIFSSRHPGFSILRGQASNAFFILRPLLAGKLTRSLKIRIRVVLTSALSTIAFSKVKNLQFKHSVRLAALILLWKQQSTLKEFSGGKSLWWKHTETKATDEHSSCLFTNQHQRRSLIYSKLDSVRTFLDSDTLKSRLVEANLALPSFKKQ